MISPKSSFFCYSREQILLHIKAFTAPTILTSQTLSITDSHWRQFSECGYELFPHVGWMPHLLQFRSRGDHHQQWRYLWIWTNCIDYSSQFHRTMHIKYSSKFSFHSVKQMLYPAGQLRSQTLKSWVENFSVRPNAYTAFQSCPNIAMNSSCYYKYGSWGHLRQTWS